MSHTFKILVLISLVLAGALQANAQQSAMDLEAMVSSQRQVVSELETLQKKANMVRWSGKAFFYVGLGLALIPAYKAARWVNSAYQSRKLGEIELSEKKMKLGTTLLQRSVIYLGGFGAALVVNDSVLKTLESKIAAEREKLSTMDAILNDTRIAKP